MKRLVAIAVACVGCSDPGYLCEETGEHIKYDGMCTPARPTIEVDGDFTDWASLKLPANTSSCGPGEVSAAFTIATGTGEVAAFATVDGAITDASHAYVFTFEPLGGPVYSLQFRVTTSGVETFLGSSGISGFAVRAAIGADGIELAVPVSALPFTAGVFVTAELDTYDAKTSSWKLGQKFEPHLASACWDASSPSCRPKHHAAFP